MPNQVQLGMSKNTAWYLKVNMYFFEKNLAKAIINKGNLCKYSFSLIKTVLYSANTLRQEIISKPVISFQAE